MCLSKLRTADARATFLRGHRFSAVEAAEMGLINADVPADRLDSEVDAIVDDLLAAAPGGLAAAKQLLARVPQIGPDEAFEWTSTVSAQLLTTDAARQGLTALQAQQNGRASGRERVCHSVMISVVAVPFNKHTSHTP